MFASHPSVPLSPPVTPKELLARSRSISPEDQLELPPPAAYSAPSSPHAFHDPCRKSNARRYSRAMATADSDCIRFTDPFGVQGNFNLTTPCNRSKPTPKRSPSAAQGSFVMDVSEVFGDRKDDSGLFRKRRNDNEEEQMTAVTVTQNQPTLSASEQRHIKKAKTDAAMAYDGVDITVPDSQVFDDPLWIPDMNAFETQTNLRVVWKGSPLAIDHMPHYDLLHPGEVVIASTLRLTPEQYLKCRRSLVLAAQDFDGMDLAFRKSDAQKCVRIDVNKTSTLWSIFSRLGWFKPRSAYC